VLTEKPKKNDAENNTVVTTADIKRGSTLKQVSTAEKKVSYIVSTAGKYSV